MPACWGRGKFGWLVRLRQEALVWFVQIEHANSVCGKEACIGAAAVIIPNPLSNPQSMMSYTTSAYFGSPRGLVSSCKI
jgi:hypothetical protein